MISTITRAVGLEPRATATRSAAQRWTLVRRPWRNGVAADGDHSANACRAPVRMAKKILQAVTHRSGSIPCPSQDGRPGDEHAPPMTIAQQTSATPARYATLRWGFARGLLHKRWDTADLTDGVMKLR